MKKYFAYLFGPKLESFLPSKKIIGKLAIILAIKLKIMICTDTIIFFP